MTRAKTPIAGAVLSLAAFMTSPPVSATTARDLLAQCEKLERGAVVKGTTLRLPENREAAQCWFYMAAIQDLAATVEEDGGPSLIGSCPSPDVTRLDLVRAFNRYARAHAGDLGLRATALVIPALNEAYPCPAGK